MLSARVLIVDDEPGVVYLCQRLLERASFKVLTETDPSRALRVLEQEPIDLLLVDIRMPIMDGFQLISYGKSVQPQMAVLVMTGMGTADTAVKVLRRGADGLLLKPFDSSNDLIESVNHVLKTVRERRDAAKLQALQPLFDLSEAFIAETDPAALLELALTSINRQLSVCAAGIYRLQLEANRCVPVRLTVLGEPLPCDEAQTLFELLSDHTLLSGAKFAITHSGPLSRAEGQAFLEKMNWGSLLVVTLQRSQQTLLFYAASDPHQLPYGELELELLGILARQATIAMENARLYSDLIRSMRQAEEAAQALLQAEKMAAVGRTVASVAHEINNPLQAVQNCLHLAGRQELSQQKRNDYLKMARSEVERLAQSVQRMLEFYRQGGADKQSVAVDRLVGHVLELLRQQLKDRHVIVHTSFARAMPDVLVVRQQIHQVLFNLLLNAIDATDTRPELKEIWVDAWAEKKEVCITIEDSGPGISAEVLERLFEPFLSTKPNGTGLGLSISYGIIESHRGKLAVVPSRKGSGACFEIRLPLEDRHGQRRSTDN